jgi:putative aldouronate transport system permease protein
LEVPKSLEEAAKIDGANDMYILFRIMLPLILPNVAVIILYYGVSALEFLFNAMIYLPKARHLYPLQLFLREILINSQLSEMAEGGSTGDFESLSETIKYATIMVATFPILLAYNFLQKYFVKGVMIGAVKG